MSDIKKKKMLLLIAGLLPLVTGCSRAQMNYQIAESIGTVGRYSNNEPVESPQMKAERLDSEAASEAEAALQTELDHAATLAASYDYDNAIKYLKTLDADSDETQSRIDAAIADFESLKEELTPYTGSIAHLCFPTLIANGKMAFDNDEMSSTYRDLYITTSEFEEILNSLYENNYILIDLQDIAGNTSDDKDVTEITQYTLNLPADKKPVILSQDNVDYSGVRNGDGIATKLLVDDDGRVKAQYTDDGGHNKTGNYDFVPILNDFVEKHPDFSYMGARGTVSVSGSEGVFGYDTETDAAQIKQIAGILSKEGWKIACAGYTHSYMNDMTLDKFQSEIGNWQSTIQPLVGSTDTIFYPYGAEVKYPSEQLSYMMSQGIIYYCGLWGSEDYLEVNDTYLRQTRRFIDGYSLVNASDYFTQFFQAASVLDEYR